MVKPTTDEVLAWAREAGYTKVDPTKNPIEILERFAALAYAAGAAAMKERAAKVCELMNSTGDTTYEDGWNEALFECSNAIRALGDDDEIS